MNSYQFSRFILFLTGIGMKKALAFATDWPYIQASHQTNQNVNIKSLKSKTIQTQNVSRQSTDSKAPHTNATVSDKCRQKLSTNTSHSTLRLNTVHHNTTALLHKNMKRIWTEQCTATVNSIMAGFTRVFPKLYRKTWEEHCRVTVHITVAPDYEASIAQSQYIIQ